MGPNSEFKIIRAHLRQHLIKQGVRVNSESEKS